MILLNQPFVRSSEKQQSATLEELDTEAHPKYLCVTAARAICDVLSTYREYLTSIPCDLIFPIVLSAAVVWQFRTEMEQELGSDAVAEQLELCVTCLSIVNSCWKNAGRYREKLLTRKSLTCLPCS